MKMLRYVYVYVYVICTGMCEEAAVRESKPCSE